MCVSQYTHLRDLGLLDDHPHEGGHPETGGASAEGTDKTQQVPEKLRVYSQLDQNIALGCGQCGTSSVSGTTP